MAYTNRSVLLDKDGIPIPQIWSTPVDNFLPFEDPATGNKQDLIKGVLDLILPKLTGIADILAITNQTNWPGEGTSAANVEQTISVAAPGAGKRHVITGYFVCLTGADAGADASVQIRDGATVKIQDYIGSGTKRGDRIGVILPRESYIRCTENTAASLYVAAAGASCVTNGVLLGFTEDIL